ncbi:MAG: 1,4-dihydroxy-2-naphthoate polyprenyltransferase [Anaerolineae bacterium CG_4_9_14_3_um_filter_57_17]|nr:1,4-dihydroxy-2-naphthoate polyprenyltransferase [bacterium]NCT20078.1 1,4-dihydroxy-2-naphthoate polyprenyltransferase [bacterium]PJB67095.1 MAG: 1,4-dihydroxy-2-naphthoate polyprenyltransferase [Anaerolineae bacterium CG_4_9_14_3_um_filter_57_17]
MLVFHILTLYKSKEATVNSSISLNTWLDAARPRTLPAAAAPVLIATALAWRDGVFYFPAALACLLISLLMQIGANLSNDLFDHERGADTPNRLGPTRVTASGLISPQQMRLATTLVFGLAAVLGLYLFFLRGWVVLALGIAIVLAALAYTGGPFPYGYYGLGDVFVFLSFGLAAVCGTYFVQAGTLTLGAIYAAIPPGTLIINILVVNNTRDIETDRAAKKRTLAVWLGREAMQTEYLLCLLIAYLVPLGMWALRLTSAGVLLTLFSAPLAIAVYREFSSAEGRAFNLTLARSAQLALIFSLLFAAGLML